MVPLIHYLFKLPMDCPSSAYGVSLIYIYSAIWLRGTEGPWEGQGRGSPQRRLQRLEGGGSARTTAWVGGLGIPAEMRWQGGRV